VNERGKGRGALLLAGAAERLRRPPGRPRKAQGTESEGASQAPAPSVALEKSTTSGATVPGVCPLQPRLLDLASAAVYLSVSSWTLRDLEAAGHLPRVRLPLPLGREVRKVLFDREDLDRLVVQSKEHPSATTPLPSSL